jgi:hypothetical protein
LISFVAKGELIALELKNNTHNLKYEQCSQIKILLAKIFAKLDDYQNSLFNGGNLKKLIIYMSLFFSFFAKANLPTIVKEIKHSMTCPQKICPHFKYNFYNRS